MKSSGVGQGQKHIHLVPSFPDTVLSVCTEDLSINAAEMTRIDFRVPFHPQENAKKNGNSIRSVKFQIAICMLMCRYFAL